MDLQNEILDFFGAEMTEQMLRDEYTGMTYNEILANLNTMWPQDDNEALAQRIFDYLD